MANDDRRSEQFIREVDEEFRRAQMKALWDRFAPLIIGVCNLLVIITAGYRGWLWWQEREGARSGDLYLTAMEQLDAGQRAEAEATLAQLAEEGSGGYAVLARLRLAAAKADAGDKAGALAAFDAVAGDESVDDAMRDLARLRAALLALDQGDLDGAATRAQDLAEAGNPWRHAAREVLGTAAYQSGDFDAARQNFQAIQEDVEAPPDLRSRAGLMLTLIEGQGPPVPTAAPQPAAAAPAPAAPAAAAQAPAAAVPPAPASAASAPAAPLSPPVAAPEPAPEAAVAPSPPAGDAAAPATIPTPLPATNPPSSPPPPAQGGAAPAVAPVLPAPAPQ